MSSSPPRDAITTHVLDQTTGRPAANVHVTLTLHPSPATAATPPQSEASASSGDPLSTGQTPQKTYSWWTAVTNEQDGRISSWTPANTLNALLWPSSTTAIDSDPQRVEIRQAPLVFSLSFDTSGYWGPDKTFYPEVSIRFFVDPQDPRRHWHVPILLGPFGYTTYRGS